jgi:hypothetical protein
MKTEEMQRTPKSRDPNELSRALQELTPISCAIVDRHGRPAPLSAAGYVLRLGQSYRLRIQSPFPDEEVVSLRVISPPAFLTLEPELREIDEQGRAVRAIPFIVSVGWLAQLTRLNPGVHADDLEISYQFQPGILRQPPIYLCPIVARPRWALVIVAVLAGLCWVLVEKAVTGLVFAEQRTETIRHFLESLVQWDAWLWLTGIALVVWLVVTLVNSFALLRRSRELADAFQEHYPSEFA